MKYSACHQKSSEKGSLTVSGLENHIECRQSDRIHRSDRSGGKQTWFEFCDHLKTSRCMTFLLSRAQILEVEVSIFKSHERDMQFVLQLFESNVLHIKARKHFEDRIWDVRLGDVTKPPCVNPGHFYVNARVCLTTPCYPENH